MTDYPRGRKSLRSEEAKSKWQNIVVIFVLVTLVFAIISGVGKTIALGRILGTSRWDGKSSVSVLRNTNPPSLVLWQTYPKRLAVVTFDQSASIVTSSQGQPVVSMNTLFQDRDWPSTKAVVAGAVHAPVTNYLAGGEKNFNEESFREEFKKFASIATPVKLLFGGVGEVETDIARLDLIKLWWQSKSINLADIEFIETAPTVENVVLTSGQKVSAVDEVAVHVLISKYMENRKILESTSKVTIVNATGVAGAGKLASDFASSLGFSVGEILSQGPVLEKTAIISNKSYFAESLAKIFDCDITSEPDGDHDAVKIIVGSDFARKYLN